MDHISTVENIPSSTDHWTNAKSRPRRVFRCRKKERETERERGGGKELLTSQLENPERLYPIGPEYTLFFQLPLEYN